MRYVQLRAFHHVATCGGFTKAADALGLTQPAVSDQVRKLEEEYDIILFNRQKRQVSLTPAGQRLLDITRRMFDVEAAALDFLSQSRALDTGQLRIVADSAHHVLHVMGRFRERHPGIEISIHAGNSQDVLRKLYDYEADVGVMGERIAHTDLHLINLSSDKLVGFCAKTHAMAPTRKLTLKQLCSFPLVLRERGSKTRSMLEQAATERGLSLNVAIEAEGREAVREIVATGIGVGIVSQAEFSHDPRLALKPLVDCDLCMEETLVCLKERAGSGPIRAFLEFAPADR